jgi:hypothetical protein
MAGKSGRERETHNKPFLWRNATVAAAIVTGGFGLLTAIITTSPAWFENQETKPDTPPVSINLGTAQEQAPQPRLVVRESRVVRAVIGQPRRRESTADFVEIGFQNQPATSALTRPSALGVVAHITFFTNDGANELFGPMPHGRWAHIPEPPNERFLDERSRTDIPADGTTKYLNLALKMVTDEDAFGFSNESIVAGDLWRIPSYRLKPGVYRVRVRLLSSNVDQTFWFELANPGGIDHAPIIRFLHEGETAPQLRYSSIENP